MFSLYVTILFFQAQKSLRKAQKKLSTCELAVKRVFNDDQISAMKRRSTRGMAWSAATVKKALRIRFSCGTSGYNHLISTGMPLPSIRTLQDRLKNICFMPGLLSSVFDYLHTKVTDNFLRHI